MKLRWMIFVLSAVLGNYFEGLNAAEQRSFNIGGANVGLENVSPDVDVFFRSMRFNRAANVWNVEVLVSNHGPRQITGPVLLSVENATNTSGLLAADGTSGGHAFVDLSGSL